MPQGCCSVTLGFSELRGRKNFKLNHPENKTIADFSKRPSGQEDVPFLGTVAVIGGGPAGLMAAETLIAEGYFVHVFDRMPSVGRKFLLAGRGGLNLTHSEPLDGFISRFRPKAEVLAPQLQSFGNAEVRAWASSLGIETFVGSSGRVFPVDMKAAPLLRAWLHRLRHPDQGEGVRLHVRHHWTGWDACGALVFETPQGPLAFHADATVLALGGASWPRLGSDGEWVGLLSAEGARVVPLRPSNCGFDVFGGWTSVFCQKSAGQPLKSIALRVPDASAVGDKCDLFSRRGECVITDGGLEGSLIYAASMVLRDLIESTGQAVLVLDLLPDWDEERVRAAVSAPRGSRSLSSHLKSRLSLDGVKTGLLYEQLGPQGMRDPIALARAIKALRVTLVSARPLVEAISTAGGVAFESLTERGMLVSRPGVFCAGEMLDWEAPTGGYLLTACLSQGRWVGSGVHAYLTSLSNR